MKDLLILMIISRVLLLILFAFIAISGTISLIKLLKVQRKVNQKVKDGQDLTHKDIEEIFDALF